MNSPYFELDDQEVQEVIACWPLRNREFTHHGPEHWRRVSANGKMLLSRMVRVKEEADLLLPYVKLFALFHDCQRQSEGVCEFHGFWGSRYMLMNWGERIEKRYPLGSYGVSMLAHAICSHNTLNVATVGHLADSMSDTFDRFVGVCLDADRLDLLRVDIVPDPQLMMTVAGKSVAEENLVRLGLW